MQRITELLTRLFIVSAIAGGLGLTVWSLLRVGGLV